ncbi:MAG: hypothetical protein MUQ30_09440 [Anaerolineae bacterium]|nr:hypothetical protein [Anaerolineae bacterium]
MTKPTTEYRSYLLRLWHTGEAGPWKASLEDPLTGRRRGFGSLRALFAFLLQQTRSNHNLRQVEEADGPTHSLC